jgi:hypothetical protein
MLISFINLISLLLQWKLLNAITVNVIIWLIRSNWPESLFTYKVCVSSSMVIVIIRLMWWVSWVRLMSNGFSPKKIKNIKMGLFCVIKTLLLGKNSKNREHPKNSKWFFSNWFLNKQENKKWQKVEQHNHKQNHSSENEKYKSCKNSFFRCRPITFSNLLLRYCYWQNKKQLKLTF